MTDLTPLDKDYYNEAFYAEQFKKRIRNIQYLRDHPSAITGLSIYYRENPAKWIDDWAVTYDPRNTGRGIPVMMPFVLFPRQKELINWLYDCVFVRKRRGLIDKCRDSGATWLCCAFSVWMMIFHENTAVGWGSRKYELVEKKGAPDSIFQKIRQILGGLPPEMLPDLTLKNGLIINEDNGSTIAGEGGDHIGRGGRTTVYFPDEFAFIENADIVSAALNHNTDVEIDISTHNGTNTLYFARTLSYPDDCKFIFEWYQNPMHDQEWYDTKKAQAERDGLMHLFEQEVHRNPGGSLPGILIPQAYVRSAVDAHKKLGIEISGERLIALDVANEGGDLNCSVERHGILIKSCEAWPEGTTTETTNRVIHECDMRQVYKLVYESVGVGAGVKGEAKRQNEDRRASGRHPIDCTGWEPSGEIVDKKGEFCPGKLNQDMFQNCNGQAAWGLRERFRKTHEMIEGINQHPHDELISIDSHIPDLSKLLNELSQPKLRDLNSTNGRIAIDKKPKGAKSPNRFDAVKIAFARLHGNYIGNVNVKYMI